MRPASDIANQICGCSNRDQHQRDIALIEADRKQARKEVVREVCEWLRGEYWSKADWNVAHASNFASAIERKFLGEKA